MRLFLVVIAFLAWAFFMPSAGLAQSGGPDQSNNHYSYSQLTVIGRIYEYSDFYGLTDYHRDLMLRIAYRETQFGVDITGDYSVYYGRDLSICAFQFHEFGVWNSTPFHAEYGLDGRWNEEACVAAAAWSFARGMESHWRPWEQVRWLSVVPSDPRPWLWGGPHPPESSSEH